MFRRLLKSKQPAEAERPFAALFRSNNPPTEDQRHKILLTLKELRTEYRRVCGADYSPTDPKTIPEAGIKYGEDIEYYQSLLSSNRLLPNEILHKIFGYAILNIEPDHDQIFAIEAIRLVCRGWNTSILECRTLWTHVPLDLRKIPVSDNEYAALETARLRLLPYLDRSGDRPISFRFQYWLEEGQDDKLYRTLEVIEWLRMLHFNWGRWGEADFRTSLTILRQLTRSLRKTDSLDNITRFAFQLRGAEDDRPPVYCSPIAETFKFPPAQNLKHFTWDTIGMNRRAPYRRFVVTFNIPWRQLDSFEVAVHDGILIYAQMVRKGKNLKVLKFTSATTDAAVAALSSSSESVQAATSPASGPLASSTATQPPPPAVPNTSTAVPPDAPNTARAGSPSTSESSKKPVTFPLATPVCLPNLTKLSLCFGSGVSGPTLMQHLASLTLASLKELEVYWCNDIHSVDLYETILSLVRRSDTSLERLATENNLHYDVDRSLPRYQNFISLLYHCQRTMTHLDIAYLEAKELEQLIAERNSGRKPPMTRLRTLTVRFPELYDPPSDPVPLLRLLQSRTDPSRQPPHRHLEDLYIKHDGRDWWRTKVLRLGGQEIGTQLQIPFDPILCEVALKWKAELGRDLFAPLRGDSTFSMKRRLEVKLALRGIGSLKLKERDSRVLIWLGIPALLARIGISEEGDLVERDLISALRRQAGEILDKWKPYLLESFRSSPYRWCFIDNTTSRVMFDKESLHIGNGWISTSEDLDWQRILGRGDVDKWAAARKGTTWFTDTT